MARLLILKGGSAVSNNVVRSLKAGDPSHYIVGCNADRFVLKKSTADVNYAVPFPEDGFIRALYAIIESERIELVIPTLDVDVLKITALARELPCRTFLPSKATVELCQDKYNLTMFLRERGIPAPETYPVNALDEIEGIFGQLQRHSKLWCRVRAGTGSFGAIPVNKPAQARAWIRYREEMRGVPPGSFTLSEYLPGRDFGVQSLWKNGTLVLTKMAERITYMDSGSPSGVSSMPALAKTAYDSGVITACENAVRAVDRAASGVYFIDVKFSVDGRPCLTEINAGRFGAMTNIFDVAGKHNTAAFYVRLALDLPVPFSNTSDYAEDFYFVRSVDTTPLVLQGKELFSGIKETTADLPAQDKLRVGGLRRRPHGPVATVGFGSYTAIGPALIIGCIKARRMVRTLDEADNHHTGGTMGEHITGFLTIKIKSDNSAPPGKVTKVVITVDGQLDPAKKLQLIEAFKKVGDDFGLHPQEI